MLGNNGYYSNINFFLVLSDGRIINSKVKAFVQNQPTVTDVYKSITTSKNKTIHLTGNHLIYARKGSAGKFSMM